MRRFRVWAGCAYGHCPSNEETVVEFADDASEEEIERECRDAMDDLIGSILESGWDEVQP